MFLKRGTGRIKLVLFDAFDTLITPRLPIHVQYAEEATNAGLSVTPDAIKSAFKPSFKHLSSLHPEYGRRSVPPLTADEWWGLLIRDCMARAGVASGDLDRVMPPLGRRLITRFESKEGYRAFEDVVPCLTRLKELGIKAGVVSNGDYRIIKTLQSLSLSPDLLPAGVTVSEQAGYEKPDGRIFEAAIRGAGLNLGEGRGEGVIMVGDELEADYNGPLSSPHLNIHPLLLRRPGTWSEGAKRESEEVEKLEERGVRVVRGLGEVVGVVEGWGEG